MKPPIGRFEAPDPLTEQARLNGPFVILQQGGDTTWVVVHRNECDAKGEDPYAVYGCCPGDPLGGHGGEATGMPEGPETWCFENPMILPYSEGVLDTNVSVSDTCGCNPPYDVLCFDHIDVRGLPSQMGINFWHTDTYMGYNGGETYNGSYCMWCGSDSLWTDGYPVECNSWAKGKKPGYGNLWNCVAQLDLAFTTAGVCTLAFDPRYDLECAYDYLYVEFYNGSEWRELAVFNGSSNSDFSICGGLAGPNPDYWGFGDTGQPASADWVTRAVPGQPAFLAEIDGDSLPDNPAFRWRVATDGAWSDADGRGDTDGAAMIDNVLVQVDGNIYTEDFEDNSLDTLAARGWTFPDPDGILQAWHQRHDPDPPNEGGDGGSRTTCSVDSSIIWSGRPMQGYTAGQPWRNGWFYRLMSPAIPISNTGCVFQYDIYICTMEHTCDYVDTKARFYSTTYDRWCTWYDIDGEILRGGCNQWLINYNEDVTPLYNSDYDSVMLCWDLMDLSNPGDFCRGKHKFTEFLLDNVSAGFFESSATKFVARAIDLLQDSFHDSIAAFNSNFAPSTYSTDSLDKYAGPPWTPALPREEQLCVDVVDKDLIAEVRLYGSQDGGGTWSYVNMSQARPTDPDNPAQGGEYYGTIDPSDFGLTRWARGTEVWYYVRVEDQLANIEYWPGNADPLDPDHTGTREDYFTFSILPIYPVDYTGNRILLVDGSGISNYDYAECMATVENLMPLEDIYEQTLVDAGYCFDMYDVNGAGSNVHIHPVEFGQQYPPPAGGLMYDAVVWFTGSGLASGLFDKEAQEAIKNYLSAGGKIVLCGDRIAYNMAVIGEDSLGGEFLNGIMGCEYQEEMEGPFDKPFVYLEAAPSVQVFGGSVPIAVDSVLVYRECPDLKDMSYVIASATPDTGYVAQPLLYVLNPDPAYDPADGAIYVEKPVEGGQCVYLNYDLSGFATHQAGECDGSHDPGVPAYNPGYYYGRVDLVRVILEDLFGLAPQSPGGGGGQSGTGDDRHYRWALDQNAPNPCVSSTRIRFGVGQPGHVSIKVYNAMGQLVRVLENRQMEPGIYTVRWDGTNRVGEKVSAGVYFYTMEARGFSATRKALVLRQ
jgi:hypothetical protein